MLLKLKEMRDFVEIYGKVEFDRSKMKDGQAISFLIDNSGYCRVILIKLNRMMNRREN